MTEITSPFLTTVGATATVTLIASIAAVYIISRTRKFLQSGRKIAATLDNTNLYVPARINEELLDYRKLKLFLEKAPDDSFSWVDRVAKLLFAQGGSTELYRASMTKEMCVASGSTKNHGSPPQWQKLMEQADYTVHVEEVSDDGKENRVDACVMNQGQHLAGVLRREGTFLHRLIFGNPALIFGTGDGNGENVGHSFPQTIEGILRDGDVDVELVCWRKCLSPVYATFEKKYGSRFVVRYLDDAGVTTKLTATTDKQATTHADRPTPAVSPVVKQTATARKFLNDQQASVAKTIHVTNQNPVIMQSPLRKQSPPDRTVNIRQTPNHITHQHAPATSHQPLVGIHASTDSMCRHGVKCRLYDCTANHPAKRCKVCKYGEKCHREDCYFLHPKNRKPM